VILIAIGVLTMTTNTLIWIGTHLPEFVLDKQTMATALFQHQKLVALELPWLTLPQLILQQPPLTPPLSPVMLFQHGPLLSLPLDLLF